jgi:hypothetical protein
VHFGRTLLRMPWSVTREVVHYELLSFRARWLGRRGAEEAGSGGALVTRPANAV